MLTGIGNYCSRNLLEERCHVMSVTIHILKNVDRVAIHNSQIKVKNRLPVRLERCKVRGWDEKCGGESWFSFLSRGGG